MDQGLVCTLLDTSTVIFIADSGADFFKTDELGYNLNDATLQDGVYGWSCVFSQKVRRIDAKGSHFEFFMHDKNVAVLAEHLNHLQGAALSHQRCQWDA